MIRTALAAVVLVVAASITPAAPPAAAATAPIESISPAPAGQRDHGSPSVSIDSSTGRGLAVWHQRDGSFFVADHTIVAAPIDERGGRTTPPRVVGAGVDGSSWGMTSPPATEPPRSAHSARAQRHLVVWSAPSPGTAADAPLVPLARWVAADGSPIGATFIVAPVPAGPRADAMAPDVAVDPVTGTALVVWQAQVRRSDDDTAREVRARRIGPTGAPVGPVLALSSATRPTPRRAVDAGLPRVRAGRDGFLVAWHEAGFDLVPDVLEGRPTPRPVLTDGRVTARVVTPAGAVGAMRTIASETALPVVTDLAVGADGGGMVVWTSGETLRSVEARAVGAGGAATGQVLAVRVAGAAGAASIAFDHAGGYVAAWADGTSIVLRPVGGGASTALAAGGTARRPSLDGSLHHGLQVAWASNSGPFRQAVSGARVGATPRETGYVIVEADGDLLGFGRGRALLRAADSGATDDGARATTRSTALHDALGAARAVAVAATPSGQGLHVLADDGRLLALGDADALPGVDLGTLTVQGERPSAMSVLPDGEVWVFTTAGRIVPQRRDLPGGVSTDMAVVLGLDLDGPVVGVVATPTGLGAFATAADGGVFAYGDAVFIDSVRGRLQAIPGAPLLPDQPVVGIVTDPDGRGYWMVAADGGVFGIEAPFRGSLPAIVPFEQLVAPVNGMVPFGDGYLLVAADGGVFDFAGTPFAGSGAGLVDTPVVGLTQVG